jgi:hypothetical protein
MFQNRVVRRIFGFNKEDMITDEENYVMRRFIILFSQPTLLGLLNHEV